MGVSDDLVDRVTRRDRLRQVEGPLAVGEVAGEYCPGQYSVNAGGSIKLMGVSFPVVYRPKTRADLSLVRRGEHGARCEPCNQVTVFVRHPRA